MGGQRTIADWLLASLALGVLILLLLDGGGFAHSAAIFAFSCGASAAVVFTRGRRGIWAFVLPGLGVLQLLPLGPAAVELLRPSDAWLWAASRDVGISAPPTLSSYPFETVRSVVQFAGYASLFVIAANINCEKAKRRLLCGIVAAALWQALDGTAQYFSGRVSESETAALAHGSFVSRNHFAAFLEGRVGAALALTCGAVLPGVAAMALVAGIALSYSRAGIVVVALALGFWALRRRKPWLACATALVVLGIGAGLYGYGARFSGLGDDLRLPLWRDSVAIVAESPLTGSGLGTFPYVFARTEMYLPRKTIEHAHNDYVEFAVELGVPLTLLGLALVGVAARRAYITNLGCFLGAASILAHGVVDSPLHAPALAALVAVLLGLGGSRGEAMPSRVGALVPATFAITAALFALGSFSVWDATKHLAEYQQALVAGHDGVAALSLRRALESNPRSAVLWTQAALQSETSGERLNARRQIEVARRLEPLTFRTEWAWAEFHRRNDDTDEAERTYARLVANMPEMAAASHSTAILRSEQAK